MTLGVYGLVSPAPRRIGVTGVAGERLRVVTVGAVSAIVGDVTRAPRPTEANLRKYDVVMRTLARNSAALLPARFGTQFRDLDELSLVLQSRQLSLRRLLRHVRNRAQITIRIVVAQPHVGRTLPAPRSGEAGSGPLGEPNRVRPTSGSSTSGSRTSGSTYLKGLAAEAARAREIPGFDPVRAAVRRWVRDERIERQATVASVYHLIPRGSVDVYHAALDRAARTTGLRLRVSGPWPPYAFTTSF